MPSSDPWPITCLALLIIVIGIYFVVYADPLQMEPKSWKVAALKSVLGLGMICLGIYTILH